jgi:hypothetical protein
MVRSSKLLSMTGSMIGWPHFLHSSVAKGGKSPEMNVFALHRPHVTIFNGLLAPVVSLLTIPIYHQSTTGQASIRWFESFPFHLGLSDFLRIILQKEV